MRLREIEAQFRNEIEGKNIAIKTLLKQVRSEEGNPIKTTGQRHLITALKKQIKSIKEEIREKNGKINLINRTPKITRIEELEVEEQIIAEEIERLRSMIEEVHRQRMGGYSEEEIRQMNDTVHQQAVLIANINGENERMAKLIREKEEKLTKLKKLINQLGKSIDKFKSKGEENSKLKKNFKEVTREIKKLKEELSFIKAIPKDKQLIECQQTICQLLKKQDETTDVLNEKRRILNDLEMKLALEKSKMKKYVNEASELKVNIERYKEKIEDNNTDLKKSIPIVNRKELDRIIWYIKLTLMEQGILPGSIHKVLVLYNIYYRNYSNIMMISMIKSQYTNYPEYFPDEKNANNLIH